MFKTVIFDLDGTLLNTLEDLALASNLVCQARGWPTHDLDAFKYFVGNGRPKLVERFTPPQCRTPEILAQVTREFNDTYAAHKEDNTAPYPGIPALLAKLKAAGIATGVVSNKDDGPTKAVVAHYLPGLVTAARGRVDGVPEKPHPAGVLALMEELGADPSTTLYVGDSDVDIFTAKNSGLPGCGVLWGFRTKEELEAAGAAYLAADAAALEAIIFGEGL